MYRTHTCDVRIVKDNLSEKEAFIEERKLIKYYRENTKFRLTNITDGGDGCTGFHHTEKAKEKMSKISKERWLNKDFKKKMINLRNDKNGPYQSEAFKKKISLIVRGKNNPNYGNEWSDEQKIHLSNVRKQRHLAEGINNPKATKIICLETGEVFELISDAQMKYGVKSISSFSIALKNKQRTAASLHWRYFDDKLLDNDYRFNELIFSLCKSNKFPIICIKNKEFYRNRKSFLKKYNISLAKFLKEYEEFGKITLNGNEYIYVEDYLSRYMQ